MTRTQNEIYLEAVEAGLEILNSESPDFEKLETELAPLIEGDEYGETVSDLCDSLSRGEYEVYDAIVYLEEVYNDLL